MAERKIPGWLKMTLELGPVALFFVTYVLLRDDTFAFRGEEYSGFIVATALFIPVILVATAIHWALTGKLSVMQVVTAVLVTVFGGLSIWLNDERFFKMKPTMIYSLFAAILFAGLWRGRSLLSYVLSEAVPLNAEGWRILTWRMAWFFVALALANEVVWRTMSTDAWVNLRTFGIPIAMFLFIFSQVAMMQKYQVEKPED
ncbi:septation protein IspZ [Jannaschia sp. S6380]|uniref:inner membrane-spanning protein YciB n=1 Tax=Jannaschia sp. S6380 TaxID=2926408 RepID=UPI001FF108EA|nr:inner membrane-spanning protein YciB [Jannaschia sp. S6380]MCK0167759.1 septation protein IspZ [Jannaschia sp. S6380]